MRGNEAEIQDPNKGCNEALTQAGLAGVAGHGRRPALKSVEHGAGCFGFHHGILYAIPRKTARSLDPEGAYQR